MIETIYRATCDRCEERSQQNAMKILSDFVALIMKIGWRHIDGQWQCPFCVRSLSAEDPPKVRKASAKKAGKLSKTAREALAQRMIDFEKKGE